MSPEWKHLTVTVMKPIHNEVLAAHGGGAGIRHEALLESAVAAPQATWGGEPIMSDAIETGAAYLFYLCRNHPFVDGNKRTALAACLVFLEQNQRLEIKTLPVESWEQLILDVAASKLNRDQTTTRLRELVETG